MLGIAIFAEHKSIDYYHRTAAEEEEGTKKNPVRNGFWIEALRSLDEAGIKKVVERGGRKADEENPAEKARRAVRHIFRLRLELCAINDIDLSSGVIVSEIRITLQPLVDIFASEITAILYATAIGIWSHFRRTPDDAPNNWLCGLLCISLFLKLLALAFTVRREERR